MSVTLWTHGRTSNTTAGTTLTHSSVNAPNVGASLATCMIAVAIASSSVSVSSIAGGTTQSAGTYTLVGRTTVGSTTVELWKLTAFFSPSSYNVVITLSGAALASSSYQWFSGVIASPAGNVNNASGSTNPAEVDVTSQGSDNVMVAAFAFGTSSGDSITVKAGAIADGTVPSVAGSASSQLLYSVSSFAGLLRCEAVCSTARSWAAYGYELVSGDSTVSAVAPVLKAPRVPVAYALPPSAQSQVAGIYIAASALAGGVKGDAYSEALVANGGFAPYSYALSLGALPPGTSLDPATGIVSGIPTSPGTYSFTVRATDTRLNTASGSFSVVIRDVVSSSGGGAFVFVG